MQPLILITDDDAGIRQILAMELQDAGYRTLEAQHGAEGLKLYLEHKPDLLITDLRMPIQDGHSLLKAIKQEAPHATVIVMTAYASVETAVDIMKAGAFDFLVKPFREDQVLVTVKRALEVAQLVNENKRLRQALSEQHRDAVDNTSPYLQATYEQALAVADTDTSVLIQGETGTGKEHLALSIYQHSQRIEEPWIVVNCGALPENLVEAELFGHTKGAFTGADSARQGRILAANGGTLFLDEIGDLPMSAQVKLLRFLQEGEVQAVGSDDITKVDVRVIAATHQDLQAMMTEGEFREDLYYRLSVINLQLPPLRERPDDILPLARHFLDDSAQNHAREPARLPPEINELLTAAPWPGNVRQLKNLCERWALIYPGKELSAALIAADLGSPSGQEDNSPWQLPAQGIDLAELEKELIAQALRRTSGNKTKAAQLLGISRHTLDYRLDKYQLT